MQYRALGKRGKPQQRQGYGAAIVIGIAALGIGALGIAVDSGRLQGYFSKPESVEQYVPKGWKPVTHQKIKTRDGSAIVIGAVKGEDSMMLCVTNYGTAASDLPEPSGIVSLAAKDMNNDGSPELIVRSSRTGNFRPGELVTHLYSPDCTRLTPEPLVAPAMVNYRGTNLLVQADGTAFYFNGKRLLADYSLARTVAHVSGEARKWEHFLFEGKPEEYVRKVTEYAGNNTVAGLAIHRALAELGNEAFARAAAGMEMGTFLENPAAYFAGKFFHEFHRELEREAFAGITTNSQGEYGVLMGSDVKWYRTAGEALRERQKQLANAPAPYHMFVKKRPDGSGEARTTVRGPLMTRQQAETEKRIREDPVLKWANKAIEKAGALKGDIERGTGQARDAFGRILQKR